MQHVCHKDHPPVPIMLFQAMRFPNGNGSTAKNHPPSYVCSFTRTVTGVNFHRNYIYHCCFCGIIYYLPKSERFDIDGFPYARPPTESSPPRVVGNLATYLSRFCNSSPVDRYQFNAGGFAFVWHQPTSVNRTVDMESVAPYTCGYVYT